MQLNDRTAVVTGGAQGIGRACAQRFAAAGARVVIADVDGAGAQAAAEQINAELGCTDPKVVAVQCDVGDRDSVEAMVQLAAERFGRLDVCLNNAGIIHAADFLDLEEADFDRVLRVNLKGVFLCGQCAAREMVRQGRGGSIINMSSVNAVLAIANQVPYVTSKGAINQLTKVMALSLAPHGIRVNGIGPGSILTDMLKTVMVDDAARRKILSRTPLGRCGTVEEVASVALFLASVESAYLTGQTIYVDGGRLGLNYTVQVAES